MPPSTALRALIGPNAIRWTSRCNRNHGLSKSVKLHSNGVIISRSQTTQSSAEAAPSSWHRTEDLERDMTMKQTKIEDLISSLPLIRYLRSKSTARSNTSTSFTELRMHANKTPDTFSKHLVSGSYFGSDKIPTCPRLFVQHNPVPRVIAAFYLGSHLCGHPGYVHGGVPFALFDDIFARCAGMEFPSGVAMTANMSVDFRKPCIPDRVYIMRTEVVKRDGRKAWVAGSIRCLGDLAGEHLSTADTASTDDLSIEEESGDLVAEAKALFIEPKFAHSMVSLLGEH